MTVNLTRIYTRTGDDGTTRLGDMSETSKNDLRLHAYADVDEANAQLGVALAHDLEESVRAVPEPVRLSQPAPTSDKGSLAVLNSPPVTELS